METSDWRTEWQSESRQRIVNRIFDGLMRHTPFSEEKGLNELWAIAIRYEEKYYIAASSESDYLRRICLKLLKLEVMSQNIANTSGKCSNLPNPGSQIMQSQLDSQRLSLPIPFPGNNFQEGQQLFHQNIPNDVAFTRVESSAGLLSVSPSKSGLTQIPILSVVDQNHNKQNISNLSQISIGNLIGQDGPSNIFPNSSGQIQKRQEWLFQKQQQAFQQQLLYQRQSLCQQVLQQSFLTKKLQQQKSQASNLLLQRQNLVDQQNQLFLSQQTLEASSTSLDVAKKKRHAIGDDWQEEVYQKIKAMKEKYLPALSEMHQKIVVLLEQYYSYLRADSKLLQNLEISKVMFDHIVDFLTVSKSDILPSHKEKLDSYERQIIKFYEVIRPTKSISKSNDNQLNLQSKSMMPQGCEPIIPQIKQQGQPLLQQMQEQHDQQQQYMHHLAKKQPPAQIGTHELPQLHQMNDTNDVKMRQGIGVNPGVNLQQILPTGQLPGYSHEPLKSDPQFLISSPQAPYVSSLSTLLTPSSEPGNSGKPIYGNSSLSNNCINISQQEATIEQTGSEFSTLDSPGNDMLAFPLLAGFTNANDTHGNALTTGFTMTDPMFLEAPHASFLTFFDDNDEASNW